MELVSREIIYDFLDFILKMKEEKTVKSYISIKNILNAFSIPLSYTKIPAGTPIFRNRVHENPKNRIDENLFQRIEDISHITNPQIIIDFGRANEPMQSIFYGSTTSETAFFETSRTSRSQNDINFEINTIGQWILQEDINIAFLPLNSTNRGKYSIADRLDADFQQLIKVFKNDNTDDLQKVLELFSIEFSTDSRGKENDYLISCAFANYIYDQIGVEYESNEELVIDGIMYPSVQLISSGLNLALKSHLVETQKLKLEKVICQKIELIRDNTYCNTEIINSKSINYNNWEINWDKRINKTNSPMQDQ